MKKVKNFAIKKAARMSAVVGVFTAVLFGMQSPAMATSHDTSIIPPFIQTIIDQFKTDDKIDGANVEKYINDRIRVGLTILFVVVFLVAIIYSALAAIKFISSQGDSSKLEESKNAIKAILMGFAAMIAAIVGIFIVIFILGGTGAPGTTIELQNL